MTLGGSGSLSCHEHVGNFGLGRTCALFSLWCNSGRPPAPSAGHTQQAGRADWMVRGLSACRGPRRELQTCGLEAPPEGGRGHAALSDVSPTVRLNLHHKS